MLSILIVEDDTVLLRAFNHKMSFSPASGADR
jgi:hypothetical protein